MYSRLIINTDENNNLTSVKFYNNDGSKKYKPNKRITCFPHEFVFNYDTPINI